MEEVEHGQRHHLHNPGSTPAGYMGLIAVGALRDLRISVEHDYSKKASSCLVKFAVRSRTEYLYWNLVLHSRSLNKFDL